MYSKKFQLSSHDRKQIAIYGAYLTLALLVLYPTKVTEFLTNHGVSQDVVAWCIAMALYILKKFLKDNSMEDPLHVMDGAMEGDISEDDIILEGENSMLDKLAKVKTADDIRISYNQYLDPNTKSACTIFSALWCISSIYNKVLSQDEIMSLREYAVNNYWYKKWQWAYFETWVRCTVKRRNEKFPKDQVMYFKSQLWTQEVKKVLDKWYWVCWWYRWNAEYNKDRLDWVLDWKYFWEATYWHATSYHVIKWEKYCYDSIPSMMKYKFKYCPSEIKWWYKNCYVILPTKEIPISIKNRLQKIREKRLSLSKR